MKKVFDNFDEKGLEAARRQPLFGGKSVEEAVAANLAMRRRVRGRPLAACEVEITEKSRQLCAEALLR